MTGNGTTSSADDETYAYDTAGRLEYETYTRETGMGTTKLYRTVYARSFPSGTYHRQEVRTEQTWTGGTSQWDDSWKVTYKWDGMERQDSEKREDVGGAVEYTTTQEYDKNGNRTDYVRTTLAGQAGNYGRSVDLDYTYNVVNQLTAISDAVDANYNCSVTCDADGNITQAVESYVSLAIPPVIESTLTTDFTYDWANRLTQHKTTRYDSTQDDTQFTERDHAYDGTGRLVKSTYKQWWAGDIEPLGDSLEHTYAGASHIQNYDGTSTYGERWHWAGSQHDHRSPLKNPNPDTAAQKGYNLANDKTPQRKTFLSPTSEGDQRHLFGQGKPEGKDSSGAGANWSTGTVSNSSTGGNSVESRLFFEGTVTATDMDRATDAREKSRIGIFGTASDYAGSSGRVTSEPIGRDLNPLGRGSGFALVGGDQNLGVISPRLPLSQSAGGTGNSVNNFNVIPRPCPDCGGGDTPAGDPGNGNGDGTFDDKLERYRKCIQHCVDMVTANPLGFDYEDCVRKCNDEFDRPKPLKVGTCVACLIHIAPMKPFIWTSQCCIQGEKWYLGGWPSLAVLFRLYVPWVDAHQGSGRRPVPWGRGRMQ